MLKLGKKKGEKTDTPAVIEGEAADGDAAPPGKKKLPLLFIIIPVAVVLLGGGGAAAFFMMQPKTAAAEGDAAADGHGAPKKADSHGKSDKKGGKGDGHGASGDAAAAPGTISQGPDGVTFYTLPDMVVNIQSPDGRPTFLKLKLTLEMQDASVAYALQGEAPRMQDMFQGFLRELRPEDLAGSAGSYQLRAEILRRVNLIAAPGKVDAVLIEEMLVQ